MMTFSINYILSKQSIEALVQSGWPATSPTNIYIGSFPDLFVLNLYFTSRKIVEDTAERYLSSLLCKRIQSKILC